MLHARSARIDMRMRICKRPNLRVLRLLKLRIHLNRRHELADARALWKQQPATRCKAIFVTLKGDNCVDRSNDDALIERGNADKPRLGERLQRLLEERAKALALVGPRPRRVHARPAMLLVHLALPRLLKQPLCELALPHLFVRATLLSGCARKALSL